MKEVTRIITVEITDIVKHVPEDILNMYMTEESQNILKDALKRELKPCCNFDDVNVVNIQNFIRDEKEDAH